MPFFRRKRDEDEAAPQPQPADARRPILRCAACGNVAPPYVYMSNGKDYCVPCARRLSGWMDVKPAGTRADDIANLDDDAEP